MLWFGLRYWSPPSPPPLILLLAPARVRPPAIPTCTCIQAMQAAGCDAAGRYVGEPAAVAIAEALGKLVNGLDAIKNGPTTVPTQKSAPVSSGSTAPPPRPPAAPEARPTTTTLRDGDGMGTATSTSFWTIAHGGKLSSIPPHTAG